MAQGFNFEHLWSSFSLETCHIGITTIFHFFRTTLSNLSHLFPPLNIAFPFMAAPRENYYVGVVKRQFKWAGRWLWDMPEVDRLEELEIIVDYPLTFNALTTEPNVRVARFQVESCHVSNLSGLMLPLSYHRLVLGCTAPWARCLGFAPRRYTMDRFQGATWIRVNDATIHSRLSPTSITRCEHSDQDDWPGVANTFFTLGDG